MASLKYQVQSLFPLDKDKGYECPCCRQFVKRYTRNFNSNMAIALITLYLHKSDGFTHLEDLMAKSGLKRCGDASYLTHYRLIEKKKGKRDDGSNRNGQYKITGTGILFCEGKIKVKSQFMIFNNKCEGFAGEEISIQHALGTKFKYWELMGLPEPLKITFDEFDENIRQIT